MGDKNIKSGVLFGLGAYIVWGLLPIYWKLLEDQRADLVLAHRIIWSFIFIFIFIIVTKKYKPFIYELKSLIKHKKKLLYIILASIVITFNWLTFIWSVQQNFIVQTSLGYYINPLVSILLGVIFLKEKLSKAQVLSCFLAAIGVIYLTVSYGIFPWISFILATSFALYGLIKKVVNIDSAFSLAIETLIVMPIALIYLITATGFSLGLNENTIDINILLFISGIATAVPLLLFGHAVLHMSLAMTGMMQYIAPTIMLILGVFFYGEEFTLTHLITFILIWISLSLFMYSSITQNKRKKEAEKHLHSRHIS